ncbi:MAG TPA: NAD(P)-binding domain-containing protein [Actinomycetota bacterium]|nr:NAD(P)-binding domain-containing protein [Actinomycetota bacterium]
MDGAGASERFETVIIGGGQAGLAVGYHLARRDRPFVILEENERIGDSWRKRWDSLRLFTQARYDGLPGWSFPAPAWSYPTKDEAADYLEIYAERFDLPVRTGVCVDGLSRRGDRYIATSDAHRFEADNVVVASGAYHTPRIPVFSPELDHGILQLHSTEYRKPSQLREGGVLVVGAGNSGAEIALDVSRSHPTWLSGRETGHLPWRLETVWDRMLTPIIWFVGSRILTVKTPIGRKVRPKVLFVGAPLERAQPKDLAAAGIGRVPRTIGARDGSPTLEDGQAMDVSNVIWCTGFRPDFDWIDLPVFDEVGGPVHERGVVPAQPGLYFVGRFFLYALTSSLIGGVGKDAEHIAKHITASSLNDRSP